MDVQSSQNSIVAQQIGTIPASYSTYQSGQSAVTATQSSSENTSVAQTSSSSKSSNNNDNNAQDEASLRAQLSELTTELNKQMNPLDLNVKFGFSDKIDEMTVSVYEKSSDTLIRKIPSDEAIALMSKMKEIIGMIFDKKA